MRALLAAAIAISALACARPKHRINPNDESADLLPLAKGATWTYRVKTRHFDEANQKDIEAYSEWKTEVIDVVPGPVTVYVIKGWPSDLVEFGSAPTPSEKYLIRSGDTVLWGKSREPNVEDAEGWFAEPLQEGQSICPDPDVTYCWQVERQGSDWMLSMQTGPDNQSFVLRRGLGVVEYHYSHHGTTNEVTATLIGSSPGNAGK